MQGSDFKWKLFYVFQALKQKNEDRCGVNSTTITFDEENFIFKANSFDILNGAKIVK